MQQINRVKWLLPVLMALSIIVIGGFQVYWLKKSYEREKRTLDMRTNIIFRETVRNLQASKLKLDKILFDTLPDHRQHIRMESGNDTARRRSNNKMVGMMDVLIQRAKDTTGTRITLKRNNDTSSISSQQISPRQSRIMQFLFDVDSLQDSIRVAEISIAYKTRLKEQGLDLPLVVSRVPTRESDEPVFNEVTLGFRNPITYHLDLDNTLPQILKRMTAPLLFSIFLVGFTILSFSVLYRSLIRQRRLGEIKNEFISNITHELKTPIATVSVAIEALRNFSANMDAQKTKEYLDISSNELQRLSLLVDKVLKLSMFEKREIELKYEALDMKELVEEVTASMRLQFEKKHAVVQVTSEGDTSLEGDRLHLVSVIFNMIDNALKYSHDEPHIGIGIKGTAQQLTLSITDAGIGISPEYHHRIFEKFFRVPSGNVHNSKGYGLGLSYVSHVIGKHRGTIDVKSVEGNGTTFVISLPKKHL